MSVIQLASNAVVAKLYNAPREAKLLVSEALSYYVEGAEHMAAFKSGGWNGRSSFFDFATATFPAGFVHAVYGKLDQAGYTVQLVQKPLPEPLGPARPKIDPFGFDPRYDYQPETIDRLVKYGRMIAQVATGGGKSRIAKLAFARIRRPTLFLTTRGVLMYQMKESFEETMGIQVGVIGDGEFTPRKGMNVGMVQTIVARLAEPSLEVEYAELKRRERERLNSGAEKGQSLAPIPLETLKLQAQQVVARKEAERQKMIKLLAYFEFVIGEEAHEAGGNSYYEILRHCKNAHYRLALTATPFMRGDAESNMRLMACFGQIGIRITEAMLIERGILAKPFFKYISTPKPAKLYRTTPWQRAYTIGIVENFERNKAIAQETLRAKKLGLPVMILVQHKKHGKLLKAMLEKVGVKVEFIFGESDQAQRKAMLGRLARGEIDALIGSTILDVGVDVPSVGMVILAGGGKAEVALRQRVGRGLRAKKFGPNVAFIIDFTDEHNSHLKGHALTRRSIIEATPGFAENIIPAGGDFDFRGLGLAA